MATIFAVPPGPWRWVTDGTAPHLIGAGRAGTAGKGAWDAVRRGRDILVPKVFRRELRKAIHG
jgi:hypothetical protein